MASGKSADGTIPSLGNLPVLPRDYPLFDWNDWPDARAALTSGTATNQFPKEAWNAIVDALADALEEAGVGWQDPYNVDDSKILTPFGKFTASSVNVVRGHIDLITDFPWPWEVDPNFRGYIGTKYFVGTRIEYDEEGGIAKIKQGNEVYPEYILELARRINLLIELLRGTLDTPAMDTTHKAQTLLRSSGAMSGSGVNFGKHHLAKTNVGKLYIFGFSGEGFSASTRSFSASNFEMQKVRGDGISKSVPIKTNISATGRVARDELVVRAAAQYLANTIQAASMEYILRIPFDASYLGASISSASINKNNTKLVVPQNISTLNHDVVITAQKDLKSIDAKNNSVTNAQLSILPIRPRFVVTEEKSRTIADLVISITRITRLLMDAEMLLRGYAIAEKKIPDSIIMQWAGDAVQMQAMAELEKIAAYLLSTESSIYGTASGTSGMFDPRYGFGFDRWVLNAGGKIELPADHYGLSIFGTPFKSGSRVMLPNNRALWGLAGFLRTVRPKNEPPTKRLLRLGKTEISKVSPRLQPPEQVHLWDTGVTYVTANARYLTPTKRRLRSLLLNLTKASATAQYPELVKLKELALLIAKSSPRLAIPENDLLKAYMRLMVKTSIALQAPVNIFQNGFINLYGKTDPALQEPHLQLLFAEDSSSNGSGAKLQSPTDRLLTLGGNEAHKSCPAKEAPVSFGLLHDAKEKHTASANRTVPWATNLTVISNANILAATEMQEPLAVALRTVSELGGYAAAVEIMRIYLRGLAEMQLSGEADAKCKNPDAYLMEVAEEMLSVANASALTRLPVPASGKAIILLSAYIQALLQVAQRLKMQTAMQIQMCSSGVTDIPWDGNIGKVTLKVDADAGGSIITIVTGYGKIVLEYPELFAFADIAKTVHGAGQTIILDITAKLGGKSARYAITLMHGFIPEIYVYAGGNAEVVRRINAFASVEDIDVICGGGKAKTNSTRATGAIEFAATCGGSVRYGDGSWANPEVRGTDLYITHAQQAWSDDSKLYVDLDVFFDPIRNESDLYIRSVDYAWTDRDNINIDTAFFLEPVREGSNLYIRQDIFGGE